MLKPCIILITGVMASGKSTIAQLLAERFSRSVHFSPRCRNWESPVCIKKIDESSSRITQKKDVQYSKMLV